MYNGKVIIGVGGSIGSGKTTVSRILESFGMHYISADEIGWEVLPEIAQTLRQRFGDKIMDGDTVNRKRLAEYIFANQEHLDFLNALSHPLLVKKLKERLDDAPGFMTVIDAALLFDWPEIMDVIDCAILVVADEEKKEQRILGTGMDPVLYKNIRAKQKGDKELSQHAHFIIRNNGTVASLQEQCRSIFKEIQNGHRMQ